MGKSVQFVAAALLAVFSAASIASAQVAVPEANEPIGWCSIQSRMVIDSLDLIINVTRGRGYGRIICEYADGSEEILPIRLSTRGVGLGLKLPIEQMVSAKMYSSGFGITFRGAQGLLGTYAMTRVGGQLAELNGDIGLNASITADGFSIPMTIQVKRGFGIGLAANIGYIELMPDPYNEQARHMRVLPIERPVRVERHVEVREGGPVYRPLRRPVNPGVPVPVAVPAVKPASQHRLPVQQKLNNVGENTHSRPSAQPGATVPAQPQDPNVEPAGDLPSLESEIPVPEGEEIIPIIDAR